MDGLLVPIIGAGAQPIAFVGAIAASINNGNAINLSFAGLGLVENDIVIVFGGHERTASVLPTTAGYTTILDPGQHNSNHAAASYKFMGASPDASVDCPGTSSTNDGVAYMAMAFRNVNLSTPMDATATQTSAAGATPDSPAITTVTDNCMILSMALCKADDGTITQPAGYSALTNLVTTATVSDTNPRSVAGCYLMAGAAGSQNPGAFSGWSGNNTAMTIALRPQ